MNIFENYYGQYGEDQIVYNILKDTPNGIFMDIGAHDGIRFSNTYFYELLGWKGLCIEAHPDYYNICTQNRPNSIVLHCACNNKNGVCKFNANYRGALSTLNDDLKDFFCEHYKGYYGNNENKLIQGMINGQISVPSRTIDSLMEEYFPDKSIELLSIDTDGSEKWVLQGFDINKWKPRVIIIEVSVVPKIVNNYFKNTNYYKAYSNGTNTIYCRDKCDSDFLNNIKLVGTRIEVSHHLDIQ